MLGDVLKKEECAVCRFCCSFKRRSLWELPKLSLEFIKEHETGCDGNPVNYTVYETPSGKWAVTDIRDAYMTDDPEEEAACPFLDSEKGCALSQEEKPFDCKAWPLRYMKMPDGDKKVCLTPTCPSMNKADKQVLVELAASKWKETIREHAEKEPYTVMDYRDGYIVLE